MARSIVEQPNGKYAVFSSIVDDFVYEDATIEELIDAYIQEQKERVSDDIHRLIEYSKKRTSYDECVKRRDEIHKRSE